MEWQPIETAPKNTPILCVWGTQMDVAEFMCPEEFDVDENGVATFSPIWVEAYSGDKALLEPDAWMPLPAPPTLEDV